jgi:hypothetical protein
MAKKSAEVEKVEQEATELESAVAKIIQDIEAGTATQEDLDTLLGDKTFGVKAV